MTVCIAALCESATMVVCTADRMWTSDDLQHEPEETKIAELGDHGAALVAGDSAVHSSVFRNLFADLDDDPSHRSTWGLASLYSRHWWRVRDASVDVAVFKPRLTDRQSFYGNQRSLSPEFVARVEKELVDFSLPRVETIVAGVESATRDGEMHAHARLFVVDNDRRYTDQPGERSEDGRGHAAIGRGAPHALAFLAIAKHSRHWSLARTLLTVYRAKKRAERAPNVGPTTDMWILGPWPHGLTQVQPDLLDALEHAHKHIEDANERTTATVMGVLQDAIKISEIPDPGTEESDKRGGDKAANAPGVRGGAEKGEPKDWDTNRHGANE